MILTRDGKEIVAVYKQDGDEVDEVKDANGRLVYTNTREITGTLPLSFTSRGKPLTDYRISGNTVQDGTPTPDAPVDVVGCGVRTGNLFPLDATKLHVGRIESDGTIDYEVGTITVGTNSVTYQADVAWRGFYTDFIQANENELLTFGPYNASYFSWQCNCYDENDGFLGFATSQSTTTLFRTYTMRAGTKKVRYGVTSSFTKYTITNPTLNLGSTALPYEPYGYKLPITVNGTASPIYLGEVESTRKIKKLVLGGTGGSITASGRYRIAVSNKINVAPICTHYVGSNVTSYAEINDGELSMGVSSYLTIYDSNCSSLEEYQTFLQQQYAAGTPVTVWYVLAEPETGIVNEPLMKIGNYADTITMAQAGVTIPTINGANTLDMASTVKPSEVYIKGKGIRTIT